MQRFVLCLPCVLSALPAGCDSNEKTKTYRRGDATKAMEKIEAAQQGKHMRLALADFEVFHSRKPRPADPPTWTEKAGVMSCTGTPFGYIYSKKSYRNFDLIFEYKFEKPNQRADIATLNTGCLIFIQGEHRRWPVCLEVQGKWLEMGMIKSNARHIKPAVSDEPKARTEGRNEPGRWNEIRVRALDGELMVQLNGRTVAGSAPCELRSGLIGFQSEGSKVDFRNIRIRVFPDKLPKITGRRPNTGDKPARDGQNGKSS